MKKQLVLIKLGGSLITDKNKSFCARKQVISRLSREIKDSSSGKFDLIIGHGSGSFGHIVASKYNTQNGITDKESIMGLSLVADAAIQIDRIMMQAFLKIKLPVISFAPASFLTAASQKLDQFLIKQIEIALRIGVIPVIYGDIILDEDMGCCIFSGERTLDILAKHLKDNYENVRIILCGDTNGVYDENGKTISKINTRVFKKLASSIKGSGGTDVTGGMIHKVETSLKLANDLGIETLIINGLEPEKLKSVLCRNEEANTTLITKS